LNDVRNPSRQAHAAAFLEASKAARRAPVARVIAQERDGELSFSESVLLLGALLTLLISLSSFVTL